LARGDFKAISVSIKSTAAQAKTLGVFPREC
jgi:hypothetical protein